MSRKGRKRRSRVKNTHHVFPQGRFKEYKNEPWNQVEVNAIQHARYHLLFKDRNPDEILDYLVHYFWGGYIPNLKGEADVNRKGA